MQLRGMPAGMAGLPFRAVVLAFALLILAAAAAHAQNSLGIGSGEQAIQPEGLFASVLFWIKQQQQGFYRLMTDALKALRSGEDGGAILIGLSFAYGVFHAAGPGHGKAVISSYMLANETALRRGALLSFASALLQALTAIAVIALFTLVLRGFGFRSANLVNNLEIASYAAVTLLGAFLLWRKLGGRRAAVGAGAPAYQAALSSGDPHAHHTHNHAHDGAADSCGCDHSHAPDPRDLTGPFNLSAAWSAILAVGLRPCSGAIIVLTFAFLNGLYVAGVGSAIAMAIGTGLTVAVLACLAVGAKNLALRISGASEASAGFYRAVEIAGALFILLIGLTLLSASLYPA